MITRTCPKCGYCMEIRASMGEGTKRGNSMTINENRQHILDLLKESKECLTVREIQHRLARSGIKRISRHHAGWNYHTVQADLSYLLGGGKIFMRKPHEEFNSSEGFTTNKIPTYGINPEG